MNLRNSKRQNDRKENITKIFEQCFYNTNDEIEKKMREENDKLGLCIRALIKKKTSLSKYIKQRNGNEQRTSQVTIPQCADTFINSEKTD